MKTLIFFFVATLLALTLGCSNTETAKNESATAEIQDAEMTAAPGDRHDKLKDQVDPPPVVDRHHSPGRSRGRVCMDSPGVPCAAPPDTTKPGPK
jgi:hypothetical protein